MIVRCEGGDALGDALSARPAAYVRRGCNWKFSSVAKETRSWEFICQACLHDPYQQSPVSHNTLNRQSTYWRVVGDRRWPIKTCIAKLYRA